MRAAVFCILVTLGVAVASPTPRDVVHPDIAQKNRELVQMLIRPHQERQHHDTTSSFNVEEHLDLFDKPQLVKHLVNDVKHGAVLPRGHVFSWIYREHQRQARLLTRVMLSAISYDTFLKVACWARDHINEGVFVYSLSVAMLHREDTKHMLLPPPFEVYPQLFVDSEVIQEAYKKQMAGVHGTVKVQQPHRRPHNGEELLSYFTEDPWLNAHHAYENYEKPLWANSTELGSETMHHRGEAFLYGKQQLLARYHLERLSMGLPPLEDTPLHIREPVQTGYAPHLVHFNGDAVPLRPDGVHLHDNDLASIETVKIIKKRLLDVIDAHTYLEAVPGGIKRGFLSDVDAVDVLGNTIKGNGDSVNRQYYKSYFMALLSLFGHAVDPKHEHDVAPGVIEHFESALRDPAFYHVSKEIVDLIVAYKDQLNSYTSDELLFPGVKVTSVDVDKLVTYFTSYEIDLNNAITVADDEDPNSVDIRFEGRRLVHKPFGIRIHVHSDKETQGVVRVFLGPKYDWLGNELTLNEKRHHMVELFRTYETVSAGESVITLDCHSSGAVASEMVLTRDLLHKLNSSIKGEEDFVLKTDTRYCGWPQHLLLPHGTKCGLPLELHVFLTPYYGETPHHNTAEITCGPDPRHKEFFYDHAYGYPFDRPIDDAVFHTPNSFVKAVNIFHKTESEAKASN